MRASQIFKIALRRRKVSYNSFAEKYGIVKQSVFQKVNTRRSHCDEFVKNLNFIGYRIIAIPQEDIDFNLFPRALELTTDLDEITFDLVCPHCGGKLEDIYIQEGLCPHCGKDIDSYLYPLKPIGEATFEKKKHTGRPKGSKDTYKRERKCEGERSKAKHVIKKATKRTEEKLNKIKVEIKELKQRKEEMENDLRLLESINYDTDD